MAEEVERVRETTVQDGNATETTKEVSDPGRAAEHKQNVASRIVWYIASVLLVLLAFRFVLSLLGANSANGFANFIYDMSHPFVSPFFSLFNYDFRSGVAHFEIYTLVAMAVYAVVAYGIARLVTINRD